MASSIVTTDRRELRIVRQEHASGALELVYGDPHPGLRADVVSYCGYAERTRGPLRRRELPWPGVVLIFDFGPTLRILDPLRRRCPASIRRGSWPVCTTSSRSPRRAARKAACR